MLTLIRILLIHEQLINLINTFINEDISLDEVLTARNKLKNKNHVA